MSKHNYTQYSNKKFNADELNVTTSDTSFVVGAPEPTAIPEVPAEPEVVVTPEVKMEPKTTTGVVVNCVKLNVRSEADIDADVVTVLPAKTEISIDLNKSTKEWFSVCTATGIDGYCMKKFVEVRL